MGQGQGQRPRNNESRGQSAPRRDSTKEKPNDRKCRDRGERQRESGEVQKERLERENAVDHAAETRQGEKSGANPALAPAHFRYQLKDADCARDYHQAADDERTVHVRAGWTKAEPAQRLADRRVRCDPRAPEAVARAHETESEPRQRHQDWARDGSKLEWKAVESPAHLKANLMRSADVARSTKNRPNPTGESQALQRWVDAQPDWSLRSCSDI